MSKPKKESAALEPRVGDNAFVDVSAIVIGDVEIGEHASIWPHTVLRGDINRISVGRYSNIQDLSLLHVDRDAPCIVGDYVTTGHRVILHGCKVGNEVLVGMGSILLSNCRVEDRVMIGAGSLVPENKVLESGFLYYGSPVKKIRELTKDELDYIAFWAKRYADLAQQHLQGSFGRIGLTT